MRKRETDNLQLERNSRCPETEEELEKDTLKGDTNFNKRSAD